MTQDLTPMKRYNTNMQEFKSLLAYHRFVETTLNKSSAKSNWHQGDYTVTKGVESDFILIFQSKEANHNSLALSFDFLGLPLEEQTVRASIKKNDNTNTIIMSEPMTLKDFKTNINAFNNWSEKNKNVDSFTIFNQFSNLFLGQELDMKKEVNQQLKEKQDIVAKVSETFKIPELEQAAQVAQDKLDAAYKKMEVTIQKTPEYKRLKELKAEMDNLTTIISKKEDTMRKELKTPELAKEAHETGEDLRVAKLYRDIEVKKQSTQNSSFSRKLRY